MATLTQQDIDVYLQLTGCKYSELAYNYANDLRYGRKCAVKNLNNLSILNNYIELLECYSIEVLSEGTLEVESIAIGDTIQVFVGGTAITPIITVPVTNVTTVMNNVKNQINEHSEYTAVFPGVLRAGEIEIEGFCENEDLTVTLTGNPDSSIVVTGLQGGLCQNNCITELQAQSIKDKISSLTKICFQRINFPYTEA